MGSGHRESPWEGLCAASAAALGRISVVEWALFRIHPAELWAGQAACTHSQEAGLAWPGCTEGHLPAPAGLLLPSLMEMELLGSESCTKRALLQQGQPSRAVCSEGIHLELAKSW